MSLGPDFRREPTNLQGNLRQNESWLGRRETPERLGGFWRPLARFLQVLRPLRLSDTAISRLFAAVGQLFRRLPLR